MRNAGLRNAKLGKPDKPKVKIVRSSLLRESAAVKRYKKLTGKKRLTKEERSSISMFGAARVAKRLDAKTEDGRDLFERRIARYEKKYGTATPEAIWGLQYGGADYIHKVLYGPDWKKFKVPKLPLITWDEVPQIIRVGDRERFEDMLYETGLYENGADREDRIQWIIDFDGDEGIRDDALKAFFDGKGDILFDPGKTGDLFLVYKSEWESAKELADDYTTSRRYR